MLISFLALIRPSLIPKFATYMHNYHLRKAVKNYHKVRYYKVILREEGLEMQLKSLSESD